MEDNEMDFLRKKKQLRQYYKQIKAGIITVEDVPSEYRILLMRYYAI